MKVQVLDHGYVELIECWGTGKAGVEDPHDAANDFEAGIIEAARQSTQGSFRGWNTTPCSCDSTPHAKSCSYSPGDKQLLRYLYKHQHLTPFEFAGMVIEVQAPIFVFREWQRHRTQSYNEMSARYAPLPDINYVPTVERLLQQVTGSNKQAAAVEGSRPFTIHEAEVFQDGLQDQYEEAQEFYSNWLTLGVPKELARVCLPVGRYSRMRASTSLRNWLAFLTLRLDSTAQWEIRQFAEAVSQLVAEKFPRTWELFCED